MKEILSREDVIKTILDDKNFDMDEYEDVIHLLVKKTVSKDVNSIHNENLTFGDRIADKLADFVGSWKFIIIFSSTLIVWILINIYFLSRPFDPYPFILLNLVLSCIAAIQAPLIMMSQNRQEVKDRLRAKNDYKVNLKSELIIEDLHKKLDTLIKNQEIIIDRFNHYEDKR
jgi:Predicted membrane protein